MARAAIAPDLRLLPPALLTWVAVWWATGRTAGDVAGLLLLLVLAGVVTAAGLVLTLNVRRRRLLPALVLVAAVVTLEVATTWMHLQRRSADPLTAWSQRGLPATVVGRVSADPEPIASRFPGAQRWALTVSVKSVTARPAGQPVTRTGSGSIAVMGGDGLRDLAAGQEVRLIGRLTAPEPGEADRALLSVRSAPVVLGQGSWIWRAANRLRAGLRAACSGLSPDAGGLLPALVVGDTSALPQQLRDDLRASGLTHLTAVSGANVAILATAVTALLAAARASIRVRVAGSALSIAGFVVLARPEPSVLRAAVMASLALVALLSARPRRGVPLLCATALVLLAFDPWLSRSFGFALSVLATAGLLILVPAWLRRAGGRAPGAAAEASAQVPGAAAEASPSRFWRRLLLAPVAVPVAALIATAPVTILLQPQLSVASVPANLLAEPAVAVATLLGVLAAVLSAFWPGGAAVAAHLGGLATGWIATVAHRGAHVPGGQLPWFTGAPGAVLLAVILLAVTAASLWPSRSTFHPGRPAPARESATGLRRRSATLLAVPILVLGGTGIIAVRTLSPSGPPGDWLVVQCDVGQGSASLINAGDGRAIMIDTGPDPSLAARCLRRQRVTALDLLVLTHFHADHVGGIAGVLPQEGAPPVLVSPLTRPSDQARDVAGLAARSGSAVVTGQAGMSGMSANGAVRWSILYPAARQPLPPSSAEDDDGTVINDSSLVTLVDAGGVRILMLGDLETDAQEALVASVGTLPPVDVVVVAHHGSARQDPELYRELQPRAALIGVGKDNDYGHPAPSTLAMLQRLGVRVLRTDTEGQLTVSGTADDLRLTTSR